jgi:hypothetical protein
LYTIIMTAKFSITGMTSSPRIVIQNIKLEATSLSAHATQSRSLNHRAAFVAAAPMMQAVSQTGIDGGRPHQPRAVEQQAGGLDGNRLERVGSSEEAFRHAE